MKVQLIQQKFNDHNNQPSFRGPVDAGFRFLATNQGVGANLTDLSFMVIPRVATDAKRNPTACMETARRESSGTANHSLVGVYGMAGGLGAAGLMGINRYYGITSNKIFAAPETVVILAENKVNQIKNGATQADYLRKTLENVKAFNPSSPKADAEGYVKLSKETIEEIVRIMDSAIDKGNYDSWKKKDSANSLHTAINKIIADTGAESKYILELPKESREELFKIFCENQKKKIDKAELEARFRKEYTSETSLKTLLEDMFNISDSFNKDKVKSAFEEQVKQKLSTEKNAFIKNFLKFSKIRSAAGFAIATGVGMSIQPMNIYLTKKKTGSDGFVGVEGRTKDRSAGFKALKGAASAGFLGLTLASLGTTSVKGFMKKMAFKGFWPTIPQLKGIYGLTIISRLMATRDKDELRESLTKDFLGFLSWLVLGDIINKLTAEVLNNTVMNRTKATEKENVFPRAFKSILKTRDEVLVETLSANNIPTVKENGVAKTFKEMLKDLDKIADKKVTAAAKKKLRTLNRAQVAGYLFSGLVLGLGIPNLNIWVTNTLDKKRKAKAALEQHNDAA